jgi:hypothetical protein
MLFLKRDPERAQFRDGLIAQNSARRRTTRWRSTASGRRRQPGRRQGRHRQAGRSASGGRRAGPRREDLRNATIVSPIDGVVLARDRSGDAVSSILTIPAPPSS